MQLIYVDEELVVICTSSDLLDPENMLPVAQDYADEKRGSEAGNFLLVMKMVRQSDGTWLPKLAQQRSFRRQIHACGTVRCASLLASSPLLELNTYALGLLSRASRLRNTITYQVVCNIGMLVALYRHSVDHEM